MIRRNLTFVPEHRSYDRAIGLTLLGVRELEVGRLLHPLISTQVGPIDSDAFNQSLLELQSGNTTIFVQARTKAQAARNLFERTYVSLFQFDTSSKFMQVRFECYTSNAFFLIHAKMVNTTKLLIQNTHYKNFKHTFSF